MFEDEDAEKRHERVRAMPIFKKAEAIFQLVDKITLVITDKASEKKEGYEKEMMEEYVRWMSENAMVIPAKIAGAEAGDLYGIRMENAAIIRKAAREIMTNCSGLQMVGFEEEDYLDLLREEIEAFRILFAEWVKGFDKWNYIIDRWGLFNPPGVNYDNPDPDDDIPFDPSDFFDTE